MDKPQFTRPFNLGHAKAGAPIGCANGAGAEILRYLDTKLIGIQTSHVGTQFASEWKLDGSYCEPGNFNALDLVMLPLGVVDGKPVFVGDEIEAKSVPGDVWIEITAKPQDRPRVNRYRWPAPAKVYPETQMTAEEILSAYFGGGPVAHDQEPAAWRRVANAAMCHAIYSGQVVTKADHEAAVVRLGDSLRPIVDGMRAARDMAIAQAVRQSCVAAYDREMLARDWEDAIADLDLSKIIASVK